MKAAKYLIGISTIGTILAFLFAVPEHVIDESWPPHARFHVLQSLFWVVGFNLVILFLLIWPLSQRERWAWWALVLGGFFVHGGYFISLLFVQDGAPVRSSATPLFIAFILAYTIGLGMAWRELEHRPKG